jgi:hypothetical protein
VIVRRRLLHFLVRFAGPGMGQHRLVVSVDQFGEVTAVPAEPARW